MSRAHYYGSLRYNSLVLVATLNRTMFSILPTYFSRPYFLGSRWPLAPRVELKLEMRPSAAAGAGGSGEIIRTSQDMDLGKLEMLHLVKSGRSVFHDQLHPVCAFLSSAKDTRWPITNRSQRAGMACSNLGEAL